MFLPKAVLDFFNYMLNSILIPIKAWFDQISLFRKILFFFLCLLLVASISWHEKVVEISTNMKYYYMAFRNPESITLSEDKKAKLDKLIEGMSNALINNEYPKKNTDTSGFYNAWTVAQIMVSAKSEKTLNLKPNYSQFLSNCISFIPKCGCYTENNKNIDFGHAIVNSWVMFSFSDLNIKIDNKFLDYILSTQNSDGWWPVYPSTDPKDASVLSTAYIALALKKNINNIEDPSRKDEIKNSIGNAVRWLKSNRNCPSGLWYDYPNSLADRIPDVIGLNGFVIHALTELDQDGFDKFYESWLQNFDMNLATQLTGGEKKFILSSSDSSGHSVDVLNYGVAHDNGTIIRLPWFIVASADSYSHAGLFDRVKILKFFDQTIDQGEDLFNTNQQPWVLSEFLVALRRINNENVL